MKAGLQNGYGHTDIGQRRSSNQDNYLCLRLEAGGAHGFLLAVADGMGGHAGGDVASEIAIVALRECITRVPTDSDPAPASLAGLLVEAFETANGRVLARAEEDPRLRGMGSTMVASLTVGAQTLIANVGDSRAYVVDEDSIRQATVDHTWEAAERERGELNAQDIAASPFYGMIARSIGAIQKLDVEIFELRLAAGEYLVLCSDGAYRELSDAQMHEVIIAEDDPERSCRRIVALANEAGGADNITCVVGGPAGALTGRDESADTVRIAVIDPAREPAGPKP